MVDVWDPKASAQTLQRVLSQAPTPDTHKQVIVIDSLSCIASILEDSTPDIMDVIRTAMVRARSIAQPCHHMPCLVIL